MRMIMGGDFQHLRVSYSLLCNMRRIYIIALVYFFPMLFSLVEGGRIGVECHAQTIIELKKGGGVRSKNMEDYKSDVKYQKRMAEDSIRYVDNLRRAFNALHTDSTMQAEAYFKEALRLRPDAPGNHIIKYNLGLLDMTRGRNKEAVTTLTDIIAKYPNYSEARIARAEANLQLDHANEALEDAQQVIEKAALLETSTDVVEKAHFIKAASRFQLHLYPEAHIELQNIIKDNPQNANAQILDALTLQQMGQPKEALNRLNMIVSAQPDNVDALTTRASVEQQLGLQALARADYDVLIKMFPNESSYYIERAKTLLNLGEKKLAQKDLKTAIALGVPQGMVHPLLQQTR